MSLEWRNKWKNKQKYLPFYVPNMKVVVFDTETTGLSKESKIIQFSSISYEIASDYSLIEENRLDIYINPHESLSDKIVEITGITDDILQEDGVEEDVAAVDILSVLNCADIIVGYNVEFDIEQVSRLASRTYKTFIRRLTIDVMEIARDFVKKSDVENHKLESVVKFLFPNENFMFHDSLEDVMATAKVLKELMGRYMSLEDETGKIKAYVEKAHLFVNSRQASMQRIVLKLSLGNDGDIFYDIAGHFWSCKSSSTAQKLFMQVDMQNIERQIENKYIIPHGYANIDQLAKSWLKFYREKMSERKSSN